MWKYIYLAKVMSTHAKMFLLAMIATKYYQAYERKRRCWHNSVRGENIYVGILQYAFRSFREDDRLDLFLYWLVFSDRDPRAGCQHLPRVDVVLHQGWATAALLAVEHARQPVSNICR
jgi:hypothetical protein